MYNDIELKEIRDVISHSRYYSTEEQSILQKEFGGKNIPSYLHSFVPLFATAPDLYNKITGDERVKKYSLFGFFPETFDLVYGSEISPTLSLSQANRGLIGIMTHPNKSLVLKQVQSNREIGIANIASELQAGPKQYATLNGFLTEQFLNGKLFTQLRGAETSSDNMYVIGKRFGEILSKLHSKNIYYNDDSLADDLGRSHLMILKDSPAILFDYGVAINLDKHPNLNDQEIFDYAKTLPDVSIALVMNSSQQLIDNIMHDYRQIVPRLTKDEIINRDIMFMRVGLNYASDRIGHHIVGPFSKGFEETYII